MNVLERIECDSSSESDVSEAENDFNKASDDRDWSESSHESDIVPSSSSSSTSRSASLEGASNSQSLSTPSAVSLLSVLKAPTPSDLSRKRKIARNRAVVGKKSEEYKFTEQSKDCKAPTKGE